MNKYVVAFLSLHDVEIKQEIVGANSPLEAGLSYLNWWENDPPTTLEELHQEVYNGDCYIHILDLNNALKDNRSGGGGINATISAQQIQ